jgi:hypothetical protein
MAQNNDVRDVRWRYTSFLSNQYHLDMESTSEEESDLFIYLQIGALLATLGQQMVFCIEDLQHQRTVRRDGGGPRWRVFFWLALFSVMAGTAFGFQ